MGGQGTCSPSSTRLDIDGNWKWFNTSAQGIRGAVQVGRWRHREEETIEWTIDSSTQPILNSPYEYPARHWELDEHGQPTQQIIETPPPRRVHHADPEAEEAQGVGRAGAIGLRRGQGALDRRSSSTTPPRSSTRSAATSSSGARCPIPASGRSRRRRPGCSSTGGITSSAASARSSARSRRSRRRSG